MCVVYGAVYSHAWQHWLQNKLRGEVKREREQLAYYTRIEVHERVMQV